jgi:hypothetical protein
VEDALPRLIAERKVIAYPHKGYWSPADTVKERAQLEEMYHRGHCPWDDLGSRALRWAARCRCWLWAHIPTTSRSVWAARC